MWRDRLLNHNRLYERGSAVVESVGAIVLLMVMVMGVIEISLALYGRNVVISAVHDAARAAAERDTEISEASGVARRTIEQAAGGLLRDLDVLVGIAPEDHRMVVVRVEAVIAAPGPIPFPLPVSATARSVRETDVP